MEGLGSRKPNSAIEPAEQGFAFGVKRVINFHGRAAGLLPAGKPVEPRVEIHAFARGNGQDFLARKFCGDGLAKHFQPGILHQIAFADDEQIRLLQLFLIDVKDFGGKAAAGLQSEYSHGANGVEKHAHGRDLKMRAVEPAQRIGNGRDQIGATAHRLGNENLRAIARRQLFGGFDQGIESATKTASRDFLSREALGAEHGGIDQVAALIVCDQSHAQALPREPGGELAHGCCLASTQEAADHNVTGRGFVARGRSSSVGGIGREWFHRYMLDYKFFSLAPAASGSSIIFPRRSWRPPSKGVVSQSLTISRAVSNAIIRCPRLSTLASLCWRESRALSRFQQREQRTPRTLLAPMASPLPEPPKTMARSHSPRATASAAGRMKSG